MNDKTKIPKWNTYLSIRTMNILWMGLSHKRHEGDYVEHVRIDLDTYSDETIRPLIRKLIEEKSLILKNIKNCGKKSIKDIYEWCGYAKEARK